MTAEVGGAQGADATVIYEVARRSPVEKTQRSGSLWVNKTRKIVISGWFHGIYIQ